MSLPHPKSKSFREALKQMRHIRGMSQKQLADRAGIDVTNIGKYENEDHAQPSTPKQETYLKLAQAFKNFDSEQANVEGRQEVVEDKIDLRADLTSATVEELISELKNRGASNVSLVW